MELGMIGPGRIGTNMARCPLRAAVADKVLSALHYEFDGREEKAAARKEVA